MELGRPLAVCALRSDGQPITSLDWRANRLVDWLAKSAARPLRVSARTRACIEDAATALEYSLAKLAAVTHAANHYKADVTMHDGSTVTVNRRDSAGAKPRRLQHNTPRLKQGRAKTDAGCNSAAGPSTASVFLLNATSLTTRASRPAPALKRKTAEQDHLATNELRFFQHWLANRPKLKPSAGPSAQERLSELRARCLQRCRE